MLYEIVFVLLVIYVLFTPLFVIKAVRFGMKVWDEPEEVAKEPVFHLPKKKKEPKMTDEERRNLQIMQNIDRYDGTPNGQVEIK